MPGSESGAVCFGAERQCEVGDGEKAGELKADLC